MQSKRRDNRTRRRNTNSLKLAVLSAIQLGAELVDLSLPATDRGSAVSAPSCEKARRTSLARNQLHINVEIRTLQTTNIICTHADIQTRSHADLQTHMHVW